MASLRKPDSAHGIRKTIALCETTFKNTIAITSFLYLYKEIKRYRYKYVCFNPVYIISIFQGHR